MQWQCFQYLYSKYCLCLDYQSKNDYVTWYSKRVSQFSLYNFIVGTLLAFKQFTKQGDGNVLALSAFTDILIDFYYPVNNVDL